MRGGSALLALLLLGWVGPDWWEAIDDFLLLLGWLLAIIFLTLWLRARIAHLTHRAMVVLWLHDLRDGVGEKRPIVREICWQIVSVIREEPHATLQELRRRIEALEASDAE